MTKEFQKIKYYFLCFDYTGRRLPEIEVLHFMQKMQTC